MLYTIPIIIYIIRIQSLYNSDNHFRAVWTSSKSVRIRTGSDCRADPVMDEIEGLSVDLGDVWGDTVFTYGLRKNPRLFGFSKQTGWAEGRQRPAKSRCAYGSNILNEASRN